MLHEKQADAFSWQNELDALDHLAEGAFNKNAAWSVLDERLHASQDRRRTAGYWAAACALMLLAGAAAIWVKGNNKDKRLVQAMPMQKLAPAVYHPPVPVVTTSQPTVSASTGHSSLLKNAVGISKYRAPFKKYLPARKTPARAEAIVAITETVPATAIRLPLVTQALAIALRPPVIKKSLHIVHINELEAPAAQPAQLAVSSEPEQKNFRFKIGNSRPFNTTIAGRPGYGTLQLTLTN